MIDRLLPPFFSFWCVCFLYIYMYVKGGKYYATEKDKSLWSSCAVQWSSITLFVGRAINRVVRAHVRAHANEWTKYLMCPFHELLSCSALKAHEGFQTLWNRCAHKFLPESLWTTKIWTMYLWYILCHSFFDLSTTCFIALMHTFGLRN